MEYEIAKLKQIIAIQQDIIYSLSGTLAVERVTRIKELDHKLHDAINKTADVDIKYEPAINS